jgi:choline transport protein
MHSTQALEMKLALLNWVMSKVSNLGWKVLPNTNEDSELQRNFSLVGMIGFSFSIVTCWTALGGVLVVGITSGGPPVMIWSWLGVCAFSLCVAYSFAEMCSAYPISGGQYSWVAILAPPKLARAMSYVTGWFMCTGIVAMGAVNNVRSTPSETIPTNGIQFIGANFILGMANLNNPSYVIERWHCVLVTYLMAIVAALVNIFAATLLNKISTAVLVWNIASFFVVIITILATNDHKQSASFVFTDFQNETGFSSPGMAVMIGLLQSFFGMCCYDAPSKMVEEMRNPSTDAPRAIIMSVYLGAVTGFIFLISAFFCIGDLETTATTSTGVPLIQIFYDSTGSVGGATTLAALIAVIVLVCANSLMAEGSRAFWAFARDRGLPLSGVFKKVDKKLSVPVYAILLCMLIQMTLNSIYFASYVGFSTVISIATFGFYLSYGMPLFARLLSLWTGHAKVMTGVYTLGKYGPWLNGLGLVFLVFTSIDFNFPQLGPVTADNMNYCSAAFGIIGLVSLMTWLLDGRKNFTGPETAIVNAVEAEDQGMSPGMNLSGKKNESSSEGSGGVLQEKDTKIV